jgi:hypothetical protein
MITRVICPLKVPKKVLTTTVSGVRQLAHSLEAGRLGSQEAGSDEVFEPSSIQAFQPSSYFTDT